MKKTAIILIVFAVLALCFVAVAAPPAAGDIILSQSNGSGPSTVRVIPATAGTLPTGVFMHSGGNVFASGTVPASMGGTGQTSQSAAVQAFLNSISTTQGAILYRGASGWVALNPGTSGYYLQTQGAGANPIWAAGGGAGGTLTSGSTAISGITSGHVLYNNAGVLGGLGTSDGSTAAAAGKLAVFGAGGIFSAMENITVRNDVGGAQVLLETDEVHWVQDGTAFAGHLRPTTLTAERTWLLPDKSGTLGFTYDFNVKDYGAAGDTRSVSDAVTSTATNSGGSTTVTSATAAFTAADTGKTAWVVASAANGRVESVPLGTATYVNSTTITIDNNAAFTDTAQTLVIGTDDTAAFNAAEAAALAAKKATILIPAGGYIITEQILDSAATNERISIVGAGGARQNVSAEASTTLYMAPSFTDPASVANEGAVIHGGSHHSGFSITGGGFNFAFANANCFIRNGVSFTDVHVSAFGASTIWYSSHAGTIYNNCTAVNGSAFGFYVANSTTWVNCYAGNCEAYSVGIYTNGGCNWFGGTLDESSTNAVDIDNGSWSAEYSPHNFIGATIYGGPSNYGVAMRNAAHAQFTNCTIKDYTGRSNSGGLSVGASAVAWLTNCEMRGSGTAYGLLNAGTVYDGGNNRFIAGGTAMSGSWTDGALAVRSVATGGTGQATLNNLITLGTHTTGNYAATVTGTANEITSSVETGEGAATVLSLPATIDLGGKTSFEIPNSAAPAVDATGEIALDTTITDFKAAPVFYDGTDERVVVSMKKSALNATDNYVIDYDAATDEFVMSAASPGGVALGDSPTWTGAHVFSKNSAASTPTIKMTGTWAASASGPMVLIEPSGTTAFSGSTSGTGLAINAPSGFAGNLLDMRIDNAAKAKLYVSGVTLLELTSASGVASYAASGGSVQLGTASCNAYVTPYWLFNSTTGNVASTNRAYTFSLGGDVTLVGDAADVLALKRSTNAQELRVYGTTTGSKYASVKHDGTNAVISASSGTVSITTGGLTIGASGTAITSVISASASLDYDLTAVVVEDKTITVTGAALGDTVSVGVPNGSVTTTAQFTGWVSASDTVTIRCRTDIVGENPASGTFRATVIHH